jgi:hypothetical protein
MDAQGRSRQRHRRHRLPLMFGTAEQSLQIVEVLPPGKPPAHHRGDRQGRRRADFRMVAFSVEADRRYPAPVSGDRRADRARRRASAVCGR